MRNYYSELYLAFCICMDGFLILVHLSMFHLLGSQLQSLYFLGQLHVAVSCQVHQAPSWCTEQMNNPEDKY